MGNKGSTAKRGRAPTIINGTLPPPRRKNEELRPREFLTGEAVERLREACGNRLGHHAHRDATTILLACRHGRGLRVEERIECRLPASGSGITRTSCAAASFGNRCLMVTSRGDRRGRGCRDLKGGGGPDALGERVRDHLLLPALG